MNTSKITSLGKRANAGSLSRVSDRDRFRAAPSSAFHGCAVLEQDLAKAKVSKAGLVSAGLRLRLDNLLFPHAEWTDFTVVVLKWWSDAAFRLLKGEQQAVEVRFMEGPFLVTLEARGERTWRLQLIEAGLQADVKAEAIIAALPLVRSILSDSNAVLELCRERRWWSSDADALVRSLAQLKSICTEAP